MKQGITETISQAYSKLLYAYFFKKNNNQPISSCPIVENSPVFNNFFRLPRMKNIGVF